MKRYIAPCNVDKIITAPASKSYAQRAIILSLLAGGESHLTGFDPCDDTLAAIEVARQLGALIVVEGTTCTISSFYHPERYTPPVIECGESGLLSRIAIAVMSLYDRLTTVTGTGSVMKRSFESIERPLRELGADISLADTHLPAQIRWGMKGGETTIDGSGGSQALTALLMTLPLTPRGGNLFVIDLTSKPYIDMTIDLMTKFGITIEREGYDHFRVKGNRKYTPTTYHIEGDWSSAATMLVAGALAGEMTVENLNIDSLQADRRIMDLFLACGVSTNIRSHSITTRKSAVEHFYFDATDCPDLIPAVTALALAADAPCFIRGVNRLTNKESNRAEALISEYAKIGISITVDQDVLVVTPGVVIGGEVSSHGDHRIAMSLALAGLVSQEGVTIDGTEAISKSYPDFFTNLI